MDMDEFKDWPSKNPKRTMAMEIAYARVFNSRRDINEYREVANRTEGMPRQSTDITSGGEKLNNLIQINENNQSLEMADGSKKG